MKDLDFKIAYQTLFLYAAIVAFATTNAISYPSVRCVLFVTVMLISFGATVFLIRNHGRHLGLINEDSKLREALHLNDNGEYGVLISELKKPDFYFHLGRILYVIFVMAGATLVSSLVWLINPYLRIYMMASNNETPNGRHGPR